MNAWPTLNATRKRAAARVVDIDISPAWSLRSMLNTSEFLESTNVGIILHSNKGVVLDCNAVAAQFFGATIDQLIGRILHDPEWGAIHEDGTPLLVEHRPE